MDFSGILIGAISFVSIGLFHPIVIKAEYLFSKKCWPVFAVTGLILMIISTSCWWSILELYEQEKRVKKGWFPANPKRSGREARK